MSITTSEPARASANEPMAEARADRPAPTERGPQLPCGGFDTGAIERLVVSRTAQPLFVEQFRNLVATLRRARRERALKSVIVTSPSPGDGKSHVAINLALTLSESYRRRVLLIDADLRRPTLHRVFRVASTGGLSEALKRTTGAKALTVQITQTLTLLPGGRPEPSPLGGLSSDHMKCIVENGAAQFDWVIVDSSPVGVLADGRVVSETVDAAILVIRAGVTRLPDVEGAVQTLGRERILGIVLNAVDPSEIQREDYYRRYYGRETAETELAG